MRQLKRLWEAEIYLIYPSDFEISDTSNVNNPSTDTIIPFN
jgi:hypothetical protein